MLLLLQSYDIGPKILSIDYVTTCLFVLESIMLLII